MANPTQHDDFGEKIGGAKKDTWQKRGLFSGDLDGMNDREADKYVKKDNIWRKPNYLADIDGGIPVDAVYFIKKVRDSLPAAPQYRRSDDTPEKRLFRQKQYIDTVRQIQSAAEGVKTKADALAAFERCMIGGGWYEKLSPGISGSYYASPTELGRENMTITDKLAKAMFFRSELDFKRRITDKAKAEQFGIPKEDKVPKGYEINYNDGKNIWSKDDDWKPDTWYVAKGRQIIRANFGNRFEALKWVQDYARERGANGKKRFVPEQLANVRRDGPDYRRGRDAVGQDYLDAFGFRGGEFGNWMSQADRQASLNMGFDALKDLASTLKIRDGDISLGGTLALAFGARGSGNAVAHYEPSLQVINLTKMHGAGSLAHEWWHALDDYWGQKSGVDGLLSERPNKHLLMAKLIETIKYKPETPEQAESRAERETAKYSRNAESWLTAAVGISVQSTGDDMAVTRYDALKTAFLAGETGSVEKLNLLKKELSGHVIPKADRERLEIFENVLRGMAERREPVIGRVSTNYYASSKRMGQICEKDGGYWDSNVELTARAFATYVMDTLPGRSDYLAGHAECAISFDADKDGNLTILKAYPEGEERRAINAVFDKIVAELKQERLFTHNDRALIEKPSVLKQLEDNKAASLKTAAQDKREPSRSPEL